MIGAGGENVNITEPPELPGTTPSTTPSTPTATTPSTTAPTTGGSSDVLVLPK